MPEVIDGTAVEVPVLPGKDGRALTPPTFASAAPQQSAKEVIALATERATAVAEIVQRNNLFKKIGNKKHVYVEGWNTLAAQYGLVPSVQWSRPLDTGGFEAQAELRRMDDGVVVSTAQAEAGTKGDGEWTTRPSYVQRSMAETRAVSKVCRIALSWVMVLGGYAATPAEEMTEGEAPYDAPPRSKAKRATAAANPEKAAGQEVSARRDQVRDLIGQAFAGERRSELVPFLEMHAPHILVGEVGKRGAHYAKLTREECDRLIEELNNIVSGMAVAEEA